MPRPLPPLAPMPALPWVPPELLERRGGPAVPERRRWLEIPLPPELQVDDEAPAPSPDPRRSRDEDDQAPDEEAGRDR